MNRLRTAALVLCIASIANAQTRDPVAAEALFLQARKDVERGDYSAACPKFAESLRLDPAPGTLLNLADCEEKLGQLASAWQHLRQLADKIDAGDERRATILDRINKLDPRIPRLVILGPPKPVEGMQVTRDGVELGPAAFGVPIPANPGGHQIVVTAPGHAMNRITVMLVEGKTETVIAEPGPRPVEEPGREPVVHSGPTAKRTVGFVVGGLGVVALGASVGLGVSALSKKRESEDLCPGNQCRSPEGISAFDDAKSRAKISDALLVTGILMVGVGVFLVVTAKDEPPAGTKDARSLLKLLGGTW
jgi:hypothetical protein